MEDIEENGRARASFLERMVSLLRENTGISEDELSDGDLLEAYEDTSLFGLLRLRIATQNIGVVFRDAFKQDAGKFKKTVSELKNFRLQR